MVQTRARYLFVQQALKVGALAVQLTDQQVVVLHSDGVQLGSERCLAPAVLRHPTLGTPAGRVQCAMRGRTQPTKMTGKLASHQLPQYAVQPAGRRTPTCA